MTQPLIQPPAGQLNEQLIDALLAALTAQRDQALNAAAQLQANLAVLTAENDSLKARVAELEARSPADIAPPPIDAAGV